jgi:plastocyanin
LPPQAEIDVFARYFPLAGALLALLAAPALAEDAAIQVILKDHKFVPAEVEAPAGKALTLEIVNQDSTAAEFESKELRVEKVAPAGGKATVKVRALKPGRYRFFDDYHESTTQGFLVVK